MEYISTKEKKEALKKLKDRIVEHIEHCGARYYLDDPCYTCDYCPVSNDSRFCFDFDTKIRKKFEEIRSNLARRNRYSNVCKLNFDTLRILFGNKVIDLEPRTLCRHNGDPEELLFGDEYLRFIELFKYLKITNQRNVRI